jgi:hypothetical protein
MARQSVRRTFPCASASSAPALFHPLLRGLREEDLSIAARVCQKDDHHEVTMLHRNASSAEPPLGRGQIRGGGGGKGSDHSGYEGLSNAADAKLLSAVTGWGANAVLCTPRIALAERDRQTLLKPVRRPLIRHLQAAKAMPPMFRFSKSGQKAQLRRQISYLYANICTITPTR